MSLSVTDPGHSLITSNDHGPVVTITATFYMACTVLFLGTRLCWIRWPLRSLFGLDDLAATLGSAISIAQSILVLSAVSRGFGSVMIDGNGAEVENLERIEKTIYASDLLYVVSLCLGKLAVALLCRRLASAVIHIQWTQCVAVMTAVWGAAALSSVATRDGTYRSWSDSTFVRWAVVEGLGLVLECLLFVFAVFLVWDLQMSTRSKSTVVLGFGLRLPIVALAIIRLCSLREHLPPAQFTLDYVQPVVYTQVEMHFNVIAATIPCLRIFLKGCTTGWLGEQLRDRSDTAMATKSAKMYGGLSSMASSREQPNKEHAEQVELQRWKQGRTKSSSVQEVALDDDASDVSGRHLVARHIAISNE